MKFFIIVILFILSESAIATPWAGTDNLWIRHDLELLSQANLINIPITTWPIPWSDIDRAVSKIERNDIEIHYLEAINRLRKAARRNKTTGFSKSIGVHFSSESQLFRDFGDRGRDKQEINANLDYLGKNIYINIEPTVINDPRDGDDYRLDGTEVSGIIENWIFGVGYIERWWGPGMDSSIILSNNARSRPGLFFQRNNSIEFDSPWLSWIGPWQLNSFVEVLDDERTIEDAKFFGFSITFKPSEFLEIGLRRVAQWGGEGRVESLSTFWDMLIGNDNCDLGENNRCDDRSQEAGNQLAGIDLRYTIPFLPKLTIYLQTVGEDEANFLPSKKAYLGGFSTRTEVFEFPLSVNFEYQSTTVEGEFKFNTLYEHSLYQTGLRYQERSIASTIDNDSESFTLKLYTYNDAFGLFGFNLSYLDLNQDGAARINGIHSITEEAKAFSSLTLNWESVTYNFGQLSVDIGLRDKKLDLSSGEYERVFAHFNWQYRF